MKYWIKVIIDFYVSCESCSRMLNVGDVAFVYKDEEIPKLQRVKCPYCMHKEYPIVVDGPKI